MECKVKKYRKFDCSTLHEGTYWKKLLKHQSTLLSKYIHNIYDYSWEILKVVVWWVPIIVQGFIYYACWEGFVNLLTIMLIYMIKQLYWCVTAHVYVYAHVCCLNIKSCIYICTYLNQYRVLMWITSGLFMIFTVAGIFSKP